MDRDGSGSISEEEATVVAQLLDCNPTTFWTLLCKYDANGDGELDMSEFACAIKGRVFAAFFPGSDEADFAGQVHKVIRLLKDAQMTRK